MTPTKHTLDSAKPVKVYWNLHRKCFSIQQNGLVVGHTDVVRLVDVTFKVSEAGRQRVIKEKRKNVHAYMIGTLSKIPFRIVASHSLTYNPYKKGAFVVKRSVWNGRTADLTGAEVHSSRDAIALANNMQDGSAKPSIRVHIDTPSA